jgi:protein-tyrosine phosphatase
MSVTPITPRPLASAPSLDSAQKFYQVLQAPAPLAGMSFPYRVPWASLASAGFQSVVCLTNAVAPYDPSPLRILRAVKFKDLYGGAEPDDPAREAGELADVVGAVVAELCAGRGVVVHCQGGTGRKGTVLACTFRALGMSEEDVLRYMATVNRARGKSKGWPESEWQALQVEKFAH